MSMKDDPYCVVSTIDGDHFVRMFATHEEAVEWTRRHILESFGEEAMDDLPDGEAGIEEFQSRTLSFSEWLYIDQAIDERDAGHG